MAGQWTDFDELIDELDLDDDESAEERIIRIDSEAAFNRKIRAEINNREKHYSRLLKMFINFYEKKQKQKHWFKRIFFWGMILCLIAIIFFSVMLGLKIKGIPVSELSTLIPSIITATVSFITAIISIPLVITNYLFDNKEDEKLVDLIEKMQNHDIQNIAQMNDSKNKNNKK